MTYDLNPLNIANMKITFYLHFPNYIKKPMENLLVFLTFVATTTIDLKRNDYKSKINYRQFTLAYM